jgi:hypothetical protein
VQVKQPSPQEPEARDFPLLENLDPLCFSSRAGRMGKGLSSQKAPLGYLGGGEG